ncbi:MAG: hypothetical protein WC895_02710 [Candidatus Shapirobacteria bacterium]|jgi:uncharacterized protein
MKMKKEKDTLFEDNANTPIHTRFEYSEEEFELIKKGCPRKQPQNPDTQRWYVETKDDWVYILRSLNPSVVFKLHFVKEDNKYISHESFMTFDKINELDTGFFVRQHNYFNCWMFFLIENIIFKNPYAFLDNAGAGTKIDFTGVHGFSHWRNVYKFGKQIADQNGADKKVIYFFSVLHDYCRANEYEDPSHGERAISFCNNFPEYLNKDQIEILKFAVKNHNLSPEEMAKVDSPLVDNITVQTCLDADRLDLPRIGTNVDPKYLFTDEAKDLVV